MTTADLPDLDASLTRFAHPTYLLRRKVLTLVGAKFHIFDPEGNLALYAKLKGFRLREDIRLYPDEAMSQELLRISTTSVFDVAGTYDVIDTTVDARVGSLQRRALRSFLRDEWALLGPDGEPFGRIYEESAWKALVRRGVELASVLMPQTFHAEVGGQVVATFRQQFNPFVQKLAIDFTADREGRLDPRLGLAAAVLLCAIEGRQHS